MKYACCKKTKSENEISRMAGLLEVVAEENRLKIICILKKGERCVCDIWRDMDIPQNLASHHLGILKEAGLVASRKEGLSVFYSLNEKRLKKFSLLFNKLIKR